MATPGYPSSESASHPNPRTLLQVGRVGEVRGGNERLLDGASIDESVEDGNRARLVVRARSARTTKRLLTNDTVGLRNPVSFCP